MLGQPEKATSQSVTFAHDTHQASFLFVAHGVSEQLQQQSPEGQQDKGDANSTATEVAIVRVPLHEATAPQQSHSS